MPHTLEAERIHIENIPSHLFSLKREKGFIEKADLVGYEQMKGFLTRPYSSEQPLIWIGGRTGGVRRVGRTASLHAFDLAQTHGSIRNRIRDAVLTGRTIEVQKERTMGSGLPNYEYVTPDLFDLITTNAMLEGAARACTEYPNGREAQRAGQHIQRILAGEVFQRERTGEFLHSQAVNRPPEDSLVGMVMVLWSVIDWQPRILVQEETQGKPKFDKRPGDMSVLAEGRRPFESIRDLLNRMVMEETGWNTNTLVINNHPIGYYHFSAGGWIAAVEAQVDPYMVLTTPVASIDGETRNHMWVPPDVFFTKFPVRGAMVGIVGHWLRGDRDRVANVTPGRHDTKVTFDQGTNGRSGSVRIEPRL